MKVSKDQNFKGRWNSSCTARLLFFLRDPGDKLFWSDAICYFAGKGLKVRTRLYMVSPQQQSNVDCKVQLMEKALCQGDQRSECTFDAADAKYICTLEKEPGPCRANYLRWFFDQDTKKCLQFVYGGCRGNSNNFERYSDCNELCEARAEELFTTGRVLVMMQYFVCLFA